MKTSKQETKTCAPHGKSKNTKQFGMWVSPELKTAILKRGGGKFARTVLAREVGL